VFKSNRKPKKELVQKSTEFFEGKFTKRVSKVSFLRQVVDSVFEWFFFFSLWDCWEFLNFFLSNFCGQWIFIFIYFLFTSCSSLVCGQFSIKLNLAISNICWNHSPKILIQFSRQIWTEKIGIQMTHFGLIVRISAPKSKH
jgi:hypothetical protein